MRKTFLAATLALFGVSAFASVPAQAGPEDAILGAIIDRIERIEEKKWCKRHPWECQRRYGHYHGGPRYDRYPRHRPDPRDCVYDYYGRLVGCR